MIATEAGTSKSRKKIGRRVLREYSQDLRHAVQFTFLALNLWIAIQFYLFVRYYETAGQSVRAARPPGVEGWLPIASLMNLKVLVLTGQAPRIHPAGMFLFLAFVVCSWIFRRSFCGWLCPVGTASEYLWRIGRKLFKRNFRIPGALDIALRSMKYILLALFVYAVAGMSVAGIRQFLESPYGVVDDVKMLNFFRGLGVTGGVIIAALAIGSLVVQNFWCRYFCPYGALIGLVSLLSPLRIRRNVDLCIDCSKCAKACPSALPVDRLVTIRSAECIGCMQCVTACPVEGSLFLSAPRRKRVPPWAVAAGVATLLMGTYIYARSTGHWNTDLPDRLYFQLIPHADEFEHP